MAKKMTEAEETMSEAEKRIIRLRQYEAQGMLRSEMARRERMSKERVRQILGNLPPKKKRKEKRLYIDDEAFKEASNIALELGLTLKSGETAGGGSVARLIEQIGAGTLVVEWARR